MLLRAIERPAAAGFRIANVLSSFATAVWAAFVLTVLTACAPPARTPQLGVGYRQPEPAAICTDLGCPLGAVPPPANLSFGEELQREFERCLASDASNDCARQAFATIQKNKGLDKPAPTGEVIVRQEPTDEAPKN